MTVQQPEGNGQRPAGDVLRVEHISKRFGAVTALTDVNLRLAKGEVLGLIGDNGAGKSTLLKILSVYHNMFLKREHVRWPLLNNRSMRRMAKEHLEDMGVGIQSVEVQVAKLSGGQRQAIAVARSVYSDAKILLLDEPLAAMGAKEAAMILDLVRDLKRRGEVSVIIIAHNYGQVLEVCDRVNLLQHGEITLDKFSSETSVVELTNLVVAEYRAALEARHRSA